MDHPLIGRIALQPARGFFLNRAPVETVQFEISCPSAGFGVLRVQVGVPQEFQGKIIKYDIGVSVEYPEGKGQQLRFRDGICIRANTNFVNHLGTALTVAGALTGQLVLFKPVITQLQMPANVAEYLNTFSPSEHQLYWQFGDIPLSHETLRQIVE